MDCCSPDVGDCQKCHPELWTQKGGSYCNWIPKVLVPKIPKGLVKKTRSNRKGNRPSRPHRSRKRRTE